MQKKTAVRPTVRRTKTTIVNARTTNASGSVIDVTVTTQKGEVCFKSAPKVMAVDELASDAIQRKMVMAVMHDLHSHLLRKNKEEITRDAVLEFINSCVTNDAYKGWIDEVLKVWNWDSKQKRENNAFHLAETIRILWPSQNNETVWQATDYGKKTLLQLSAKDMINILKSTSGLNYTILNTSLPRAMRLVGRTTKGETYQQHLNALPINRPFNQFLTGYFTDSPESLNEYVSLKNELRESPDKQSVVPPMAGLIYKAVQELKLALDIIHRHDWNLPVASRTSQEMVNHLYRYLQVVMQITRVSRTGETINKSMYDTYFILRSNDSVPYFRVDATVGAFCPEVLTAGEEGVSIPFYIEETFKGKSMGTTVRHLHETLPQEASLLSLPHAIALVTRVMLMYNSNFMNKRYNKDMRLLVKVINASGDIKNWETSYSGVRKQTKSAVKSLDLSLVETGAKSINDFSMYSTRYLVAYMVKKFNILDLTEPQQMRNIEEYVEFAKSAKHADDVGYKIQLSQAVVSRVSAYLRTKQFGHTETSEVMADVYSVNEHRLRFTDNKSSNEMIKLDFEDVDKTIVEKEAKVVFNLIRRKMLNAMHLETHGETKFGGTIADQALKTKVLAVQALICQMRDEQNIAPETLDDINRHLIEQLQLDKSKTTAIEFISALLPTLDLKLVYINTKMLPQTWSEQLHKYITAIHKYKLGSKSLHNDNDKLLATAETCKVDLNNVCRLMFHTSDMKSLDSDIDSCHTLLSQFDISKVSYQDETKQYTRLLMHPSNASPNGVNTDQSGNCRHGVGEEDSPCTPSNAPISSMQIYQTDGVRGGEDTLGPNTDKDRKRSHGLLYHRTRSSRYTTVNRGGGEDFFDSCTTEAQEMKRQRI